MSGSHTPFENRTEDSLDAYGHVPSCVDQWMTQHEVFLDTDLCWTSPSSAFANHGIVRSMHNHLADLTSLKDSYLVLVNTIVPGPQSFSYFIPLLLLPVSLLIPIRILSHNTLARVFFPVILASTVHAWICMRGVDVISFDTLWWSLYYLVLRDPRKDFRRLHAPKQDEVELEGKSAGAVRHVSQSEHAAALPPAQQSGVVELKERPYPEDLRARLEWVFQLLTERPLTSWKTGRPSHDAGTLPPHVSQSRSRFIFNIIAILLPVVFITMPLALQLATQDPLYSDIFQHRPSPAPHTVRFIQSALPMPLLRPLTLGLYLYSLMTLLFLPTFLLPVLATYIIPNGASAHWSPHTWPRPHFGPISSVFDYGLRGLWGKWWHQQMRHATAEPGRWIASRSHLTERSLARYALICGSAFLLSGTTHMGLVPPEPGGEHSAWDLRLRAAGFFWLQPLGILIEVCGIEKVIHWLGKGHRWVERSLRVVWVLLFMSFALRCLLVPFVELRYWTIWPPPFFTANWNSIFRGDWIP